MLHGVAVGQPLTAIVQSIGRSVHAEAWSRGLFAFDKQLHARIDTEARKTHSRLSYRKAAARALAQRAGYRGPQWSVQQITLIGSLLLDCALQSAPETWLLVDEWHRGRSVKTLTIAPEALADAESAVEASLRAHPVFTPCKTTPKPWTRPRAGGYWDENSRFNAPIVRTPSKATAGMVAAAMRDGSMQPHVDAVNNVQAVAWDLDPVMLDLVRWAYDVDAGVKGIPSRTPIAPPARVDADVWSSWTVERQRAHRYQLGQIAQANRSLVGDTINFRADIATAEGLVGAPFYLPHNCDWRGRVYSIPHFSFSRDDRVRGMFRFATGVPIGSMTEHEGGLYWLSVHCANTGDYNKVSKRPFAERVGWCLANQEMIRQIANDPKGTVETWKAADKPFLFVAACRELARAWAEGESFVTRLPVSFDGSCSGLQHLCAMTRAEEGALVNLTPSDCPQDIYQVVADRVRARVEADVGKPAVTKLVKRGDEEVTVTIDVDDLAKRTLAYGVTRKLVKRAVMTYAYSSKQFGMAEQFREDTMQPLALAVMRGDLQAHPFGPDHGKQASKFLAQHTFAAIEEVVQGPARAMKALQGAARALAHEGKCVRWTTPTGLPFLNRYMRHTTEQVRLWLSDVQVRVSLGEETLAVDKDRCANGIAPNFVHSLDAAHLAMVVNAAVSEGITSLALVHDSFGCHAPHGTRFRQIIREQFHRLYTEFSPLASLLEQAKLDLTDPNCGRLPDLPEMGRLELNQILSSDYAFA
jgi:DNA-directed RNA polymerase